MGITCLTACPECSRHVRCGERTCPFCGASVTTFMRVLEYRVTTRLDRYRGLSLGAALTAAGFVSSCDGINAQPLYGISCTPTTCPDIGGTLGNGGSGGTGFTLGGVAGTSTGGAASGASSAGNANIAGAAGEAGAGGDASEAGDGGAGEAGSGGVSGAGEAGGGGAGGT